MLKQLCVGAAVVLGIAAEVNGLPGWYLLTSRSALR
jgi:hypothetical protein